MTTAPVAALLLGFFFESVSAADGIPVVDRSGQTAAAIAQPAGAAPATIAPSVSARPVITEVGSATARPSASSSAVIGELLMQLDQLQQEISMLRGQIEQQQHRIKRMQTDQRDRYRDLDRRLSLLNQKVFAAQSPAPVAQVVLPTPISAPSIAPTTANTTPAAPKFSDAQAFKAAFALVRQGKFDDALKAFNGFLQLYPDSSLTANVLYWTGEVHRAQPSPDLNKAIAAYRQVVERYAGNTKSADAYYKLGLSYQSLGLADQAKASMSKVVELFPDQAPAVLARDFLKQHR